MACDGSLVLHYRLDLINLIYFRKENKDVMFVSSVITV